MLPEDIRSIQFMNTGASQNWALGRRILMDFEAPMLRSSKSTTPTDNIALLLIEV